MDSNGSKHFNLYKVFEHIAKKIKHFKNEDLEKLENGFFDIYLRDAPEANKKIDKIETIIDVREIVKKLEGVTNRAESFEILEHFNLTVAQLTQISKCLDIPLQKGMKKEQLSERIVEKTIGYRLNSEAIRGKED